MRVSSVWLLLLMAAFSKAIATGSPIIATVIENNEESHILNNYNGWINPEDLPPMPQCIVQQHHSTWLAAMTDCAAKQCTSHFAFICTHHQWLTEVSCLGTHFSPDLLKSYLPYCSRSVLSKAQLYSWVWNTTSRTWFVDVGDANELQNLSPASLVDGYADVDVMNYAPVCLTESVSTPSRGAYRHVMASCMFTASTQNTGNAARPWEYSESLQSIIPLSYETVGYDLTGHHISEGSYFDKNCFCSYFAIDPENEPCSGSRGIDLTRERLWINATCGSSSLPQNWTDTLQTTDLAYIPLEDWNWPKCVADMPKQVIELSEQCVAEACEVDSDGHCSKIKPAVERACFCHNISYNSCGGSCQIFETRIDYVNWLRSMCGDVDDWHGLPDDWRRLAAPTALDMIPWKWTVKPSNITGNCVSKGWKLGSIALVNITTLLAMLLMQRTSIRQIAHRWQPRSWYSKGSLIAASQILANFINTLLVQRTPGYEEVPDTQLLLLWCTMPRLLSWLPNLLVGVQPFETMNMSAVGACLFAEVFLQGFSSYYMLMTVRYGVEHNIYLGHTLEKAERAWAASRMYYGALVWFIMIGLALVLLVWATHRINEMTEIETLEPSPKLQRDGNAISRFPEVLMAQVNKRYTRFREKATHIWTVECTNSEKGPLIESTEKPGSAYGTFSATGRYHWASHRNSVGLYAALTLGLFGLWIAQWLFWSGLVVLSSEEYCPPELGSLTGLWIVFSLAGAIFGAP
ncbi:hypothetical protein DPV78_009032 [Talaromyces pinophilus]|nr:hypothetical protein DPV78_009032 [Talaromyces pinophilus]